jgi:hypothetical protein
MTADGRRRFVPPVLLALAAALLLLVGTPYANGKFTKTVTNSVNTAATSIFVSCQSTAIAAGPYLAWPLNEPSGTVAKDLSNSAHPGTYSASGVTYGASGPCRRDGAKAVTLDGAAGLVSTTTAVAAPTTFTEEIWFNTGTATGGKLIGFGDTSNGSSAVFDRHIYMTNGAAPSGGKLIFGVYPGAAKTVISSNGYNDSKWHQVVATLGTATGVNGMRLYVDGALVASDTTVTTAQSITGYWRVGYDNLTGWTSAPTSSFFKGSVAFAQVYNTALTPAQILAQYNAGTS